MWAEFETADGRNIIINPMDVNRVEEAAQRKAQPPARLVPAQQPRCLIMQPAGEDIWVEVIGTLAEVRGKLDDALKERGRLLDGNVPGRAVA